MSYFRSTFERRFRPLERGTMKPATVIINGRAVPAYERKEQEKRK